MSTPGPFPNNDRLIGEDFTERRQELIRDKAPRSDQHSELLLRGFR